MKAIVINDFGDVNQLVLTDLPKPVLKADEVMVRVKALSINPVDVKTRAGKGVAGRIKNELPIILGWDISGTITEVGAQVTDFKVGDDVFGMVNFPGHGKAYAEYVAAPANQLAKKPDNVSFEEAAAATLAALTAYHALVKEASLQSGQKVLIHAAAGGVGHFAVQLARHLGAYVIGTSSAINKDFVLSLGADQHVDYVAQPFEDVVSDVDVALDLVGGDIKERSLAVVKPGGKLVSILGMSEELAAQARAKDVTATAFLVNSNGEDMHQVATLLENGVLKSYVSQTFPFANMTEAHRQQETGKTRGKLVVTLD
ncbi:NADP-dependent oxidoreductase [Spirosoma sp.]|uniref:NADP-dependent oxidoreductase n=1 Tax=Spirosoma sp. TaxID=1899569 RepID=UPI003B3ACB89